MIILGIDPGLSGGLAWLHVEKGVRPHLLGVADVPTRAVSYKTKTRRVPDLPALVALLRDPPTALSIPAPDHCMIEEVNARPGEAARAVFRFGFCAGVLAGAASAVCPQVQWVTPQVWRRKVGLTGDKTAARALAANYFPDHAPAFARAKDDGRAEAALIGFSLALNFTH